MKLKLTGVNVSFCQIDEILNPPFSSFTFQSIMILVSINGMRSDLIRALHKTVP